MHVAAGGVCIFVDAESTYAKTKLENEFGVKVVGNGMVAYHYWFDSKDSRDWAFDKIIELLDSHEMPDGKPWCLTDGGGRILPDDKRGWLHSGDHVLRRNGAPSYGEFVLNPPAPGTYTVYRRELIRLGSHPTNVVKLNGSVLARCGGAVFRLGSQGG